MKKNRFLRKLLCVLVVPAFVIACDDDDGVDATVDFAGVGTGYAEGNGDALVTIPFRNADASISESSLIFDGTATEGEDYEIISVSQEGIQLSLKNDPTPEYLETLRIRLAGSTGNAIHTVTLADNDPGFMNIDLTWPGAPDMDLYLLYAPTEDDDFEILRFSDPGHLSLDWKEDDGIYGLSYNYYAGSVDPLNFTSTFTPTGVFLEGSSDPLVFNGTYTLANIDKVNIQIEQTFVKNGIEMTEFTDIEEPATGSRAKALRVKMRKAIAEYKASHQ